MNKKVLFTSQAALIAALYVVLTFFSNAFGMASGTVQVRISEALTILPFFTPAAIPASPSGVCSATSLRAAHRWISFLAPAPHCWEHWVPMPCAVADGWSLSLPLPPI